MCHNSLGSNETSNMQLVDLDPLILDVKAYYRPHQKYLLPQHYIQNYKATLESKFESAASVQQWTWLIIWSYSWMQVWTSEYFSNWIKPSKLKETAFSGESKKKKFQYNASSDWKIWACCCLWYAAARGGPTDGQF